MSALRQTVLSFDQGTAATKTPHVRGGKGAGLAEMTDLGLPVPPGFTLTTGVSRAYMEHGRLPKRVSHQLGWEITALEKKTGHFFGDDHNPLLVSVRSGAPMSMPGMMDTVLNVGLTRLALSALSQYGDEHFAFDTYRRFLLQFSQTVLQVPGSCFDGYRGVRQTYTTDQLKQMCDDLEKIVVREYGSPLPDSQTQLRLAIEAVLRSWSSARAIEYRTAKQVASELGTAVNIQAMVFGNLNSNSGTGVVFSHNVSTGDEGLYGEFLFGAQGEDVVSGTSTPLPVSRLEQWKPNIYTELSRSVDLLAQHMGSMVDVEFTIENGRLFILQARQATRSARAAATFAVHQEWAKHWDKQQAVTSLTKDEIEDLRQTSFSTVTLEVATKSRLLFRGLAASPGAVVGRVAFSSEAALAFSQAGDQVVLVRPDTSPDDLAGMLVASAIVTAQGGVTCHSAVVARDIGVAAVVGVGEELLTGSLHEGDTVSVDGATGRIFDGELPVEATNLSKEVNIFLRWEKRFGSSSRRIEFDWARRQVSANRMLNDFYLLDAMAQAARGSNLASEIAEWQAQTQRDQATCFATYLLIAISSEASYYWERTSQSDSTGNKIAGELLSTFGLRPRDRPHWLADEVVGLLIERSAEVQARYVELIFWLFRDGRCWSESFGGPKWATIAETLLDYLRGNLQVGSFVDRVYCLRHNGGRLFDKHTMVSHLTRDHTIAEQLDIKHQAKSIRDLYVRLVKCSTRSRFGRVGDEGTLGFSDEIEKLWRRGEQQGLW